MNKKKIIFSAAAAAAILFSGAGVQQADAAQVKYQVNKKVIVKNVHNQQQLEDLLKQIQQKYNVTLPAAQLKQNCGLIQIPTTAGQAPKQQEQAKQTQQAAPAESAKPSSNQTAPKESAKEETAKKPAAAEANSEVSAFEKEVVELTNKERAKQGLSPLTLDNELSKVARTKSQDMKNKNYFDHTSPTYGSPFDMMKSFGISYKSAGENIAMGQKTPEEVVEAWMNSQGHRENIMNSSFTHIGVGYVESGNYWTQMFIGK
ncbi:CAP domain-containing protein [Bacillus massiliglaciei]|uniref:CAP domain-containing protein n=1 Tax=Bacillus massiliglaciei TaxID=1816693 RepID=UPI000ACE0050|nr:CAP domain-containing protein [Bacillus massiliglaciei]